MRRHISMLLVCLSACAGEAGAPTLDTGLPRDVPADQVTPAEAQLACVRYEELANEALGVDAQRQVGCVVQGIASQLSGGASCSGTVATCLASPSNAQPLDFDCESAVTFAPSGCTATIGELETCVNAVSEDIDELTSAIRCSLVSDLTRLAELVPLATAVADPTANPACAGLSAECIELLGWTADVTPTLPMP